MGLRTPDTNRDIFVVLEQAGEIDPALSERLQSWASFRNVLVHDYLTIDHGIAYRAIRNELGDLDAFRPLGPRQARRRLRLRRSVLRSARFRGSGRFLRTAPRR